MAPHQTFRQRSIGKVVQIRAHLHPTEGQHVILWDDIRDAFPGATQVYFGTKLISRMRDSKLNLVEPSCILYEEDKEFEVEPEVKGEYWYSHPLPSWDNVVQSSTPPLNAFINQCRSSNIASLTDVPLKNATSHHIPYILQEPRPANYDEQSIPLWDKDDSVDSSTYPEGADDNTSHPLDVSTENDASGFEGNSESSIFTSSNILTIDGIYSSISTSEGDLVLDTITFQNIDLKKPEGAYLEQRTIEIINQDDKDTHALHGNSYEDERGIAKQARSCETYSVKLTTDFLLNDANSCSNEDIVEQLSSSTLMNRGEQGIQTSEAGAEAHSINDFPSHPMEPTIDNLQDCDASTEASVSRPILLDFQNYNSNEMKEIDLAQMIIMANHGDKDIQLKLGDLYMNGQRGLTRDYSAAMTWYQKAADQGYANAQFKIGYMYHRGHGVQQDYSTAMTWYQKAADQGDADAQLNIGILYHMGHGVQQDYSIAMTWNQKAADQEDTDARSHFQFMIETSRVYLIILLYGQKSADIDYKLYFRGEGFQQDCSKAMIWFRKAADQGHVYEKLVVDYLNCHSRSLKQNKSITMYWYLKAAFQGDIPAQVLLGRLYFSGPRAQQNHSEAMIWFRRAANQGYKHAQYNIGYLYRHGYGVRQDYSEAMNWFRKAADQGHVNSQLSIGYLYRLGLGIKQNYSEAMIWYQEAASNGNATAQFNIGSLYETGRGVSKNPSLAIKWYRNAAEQGHEEAMRCLQLLK
ncbi:hypothetical protein FBU30_007299 [Linnemannia zychae]|nr:hypothetical protein FBU30_007299 [Linnemannia zychae]